LTTWGSAKYAFSRRENLEVGALVKIAAPINRKTKILRRIMEPLKKAGILFPLTQVLGRNLPKG
jgi:hypothetical protein